MRRVLAFVLPIYRMPRWQFWIAVVVWAVCSIALSQWTAENRRLIEAAIRSNTPAATLQSPSVSVIGSALFGYYVYIVSSVNRLHDLNKSGWRMMWVLVPSAKLVGTCYVQLYAFGNAMLPSEPHLLNTLLHAGPDVLLAVWAIMVLSLFFAAIAQIIYFIQCAFYRGDEWGNDYGRAPREA